MSCTHPEIDVIHGRHVCTFCGHVFGEQMTLEPSSGPLPPSKPKPKARAPKRPLSVAEVVQRALKGK